VKDSRANLVGDSSLAGKTTKQSYVSLRGSLGLACSPAFGRTTRLVSLVRWNDPLHAIMDLSIGFCRGRPALVP
jgi:hypothetical protein